jgi:nicotinamide-nucleotide amidase
MLVDDTSEELGAALRSATAKARLVLTTGGLGPTVNDVTREVMAEVAGVPLREDADLLQALAHRFGQPSDQLRDNLRRQALVPARGGYLPNDRGTAAGLVFATADGALIALPGPPRELQPMVTEQLVPWLRGRLGLPEREASVTLRFVGIGQSAIDATLREKVPLPANTVTTSRFDGNRVDFTFSLREDTPAARSELAQVSAAVATHLGRYLYATNQVSLEEVAWARLAARGSSLVLAEAQGAHLASAFARAALPRSAQITSIAASNERGLRQLLGLPEPTGTTKSESADGLQALGEAARRLTRAAWALAVGETTDPAGGPVTLLVVLGDPEGHWEHWRLAVHELPETGRPGLVSSVLDRLRRLERQPPVPSDTGIP